MTPKIPVIIADEPSRYLDPASRRQVYASLIELAHEHNKIVIVVSHDADLAPFDRVLVMNDGRIQKEYAGRDVPNSIDSVARILAGDE